MVVSSKCVAISGGVGTGKSTLARVLAEQLDFAFVGESDQALQYLEDLRSAPKRWAFEAQIAFLAYKSTQILHALNDGKNIVLDRSLGEDAAVFARHHFESGDLDRRAFDTYCASANCLLKLLPATDFVVVCRSSPRETLSRLLGRGVKSEHEDLSTFISHTRKLYSVWLASLDPSFIYEIDTEVFDVRSHSVVQQVAADVRRLLAGRAGTLEVIRPLQNELETN